MDEIKDIYALLRKNGERITQQKKMILSVLLDNTTKMLSVNEILKEMPKDANVDNATVYRNVQRLSDLGVIETIIDEKGISRYVISCNNMHHHHLICISCGKILSIPCQNNYWDKYAKEINFEESYHKLEIYGKCEDCKNLN